jgi:LemA protein
MPIGLIVILVIVAIVGIAVWAVYNRMVKMSVRVDESWSDITVQLKRRADLIPNLINTVKGYAKHEREVLQNVTEARNKVLNSSGVKETAESENMLTGALKSLFAVAEAYPDLKADQNFLQLQQELVDAEDKIMAARRFYNGATRDLNTSMRVFPNNLIVKFFNFKQKEFFEVEDMTTVSEPVEVKF